MIRAAFLLLVLALSAVPAAADALLDSLRAGAAAANPASLSFESVVRTAGPREGETRTTVERWDGSSWTLVSVNGTPPSPAEAAKFSKAKAEERTVPSYNRLATYLAGPVEKRTDAAGNTVYFIPALPKGSFLMWGDNSRFFSGEAVVGQSPRGAYIKRFRAWVREPFRLRVVVKVDRFDLLNEYRFDGPHPELARQVTDTSGSLLGKTGKVRVESAFSDWTPGAAVESAAR